MIEYAVYHCRSWGSLTEVNLVFGKEGQSHFMKKVNILMCVYECVCVYVSVLCVCVCMCYVRMYHHVSARGGVVQVVDTVLQATATGEGSDGHVLQAASGDSVGVRQE